MSRQSSQTVTYKALIAWAEKKVTYAKSREAEARKNCTNNLEPITHDIACGEVLVKMLRKCEPGKQADLFQKFESVKK